MTPLSRLGFVAFVLLALFDCGGGQNQSVLRKNIGIDLAQVGSFVALSGTNGSGQALQAGLSAASPFAPSLATGSATDPRLIALTLSGETLDVSLVEQGEAPGVVGIYPNTAWVLFSTWGFSVQGAGDDSNGIPNCQTIAARRKGGALYCASLRILSVRGGDGSVDFGGTTVRANAAGDIVYAPYWDDSGKYSVLYKLEMSETGAPSATLVSSSLHPNWFLSNAEGDLLVNFYASSIEQTTSVTEILPLDGGSPFTLQGANNAYAISGEAAGADGNTFYVISAGGNQAGPFDGIVRVVTKNGTSFVETPQTVDVGDANCKGLYRLGDGIYMVCIDRMALIRVIADGAVIANPTMIPFMGIDHFVGGSQYSVHEATGQVVLLASTGTGYKFVRHDGAAQVDIPIDPNINLLRYSVAMSGAIRFLATLNDTGEKVWGEVAAGSIDVTITPAGAIDPAQVVAFTQIN